MTSISLTVNINHIKDTKDFLRLVEEMNRTHLPRTLKRGRKTIAMLFPAKTKIQAGRNVIDFNQDIDSDTVKEILSEPRDISPLLKMSGIIDDAEDVSSDKKNYF